MLDWTMKMAPLIFTLAMMFVTLDSHSQSHLPSQGVGSLTNVSPQLNNRDGLDENTNLPNQSLTNRRPYRVPAIPIPATQLPPNTLPGNQVPSNTIPAQKLPGNTIPATQVPPNTIPVNPNL